MVKWQGLFNRLLPTEYARPANEMLAASLGEVVACFVRVPTEVVKQRAQAMPHRSSRQVAWAVYKKSGFGGFYRGYLATVLREIPFSLIQFPIWEATKRAVARSKNKADVNPSESAACGSFAGVIAAGITTPFDVAKTRIMLAFKVTGEADTVWQVCLSNVIYNVSFYNSYKFKIAVLTLSYFV